MGNNISINKEDLNKNYNVLLKLLASEYVLYLNTLSAHWNITGSSFASIHALLEKQYESIKNIIDDTAERIRILGYKVPASHSKYLHDAEINNISESLNFIDTIKSLCKSYEDIINLLRQSIKEIEKTNDFGTEDLLVSTLKEYEKSLWMLDSHLQKSA
jgi:starvation-inducible DNA-binding protein